MLVQSHPSELAHDASLGGTEEVEVGEALLVGGKVREHEQQLRLHQGVTKSGLREAVRVAPNLRILHFAGLADADGNSVLGWAADGGGAAITPLAAADLASSSVLGNNAPATDQLELIVLNGGETLAAGMELFWMADVRQKRLRCRHVICWEGKVPADTALAFAGVSNS